MQQLPDHRDRVLVAGWFSFEQGGATAGDLLACDVTRDWIRSAHLDSDVALAFPFGGGLSLHEAHNRDYSQVVFVCGPFGTDPMERRFLREFRGHRLIGLNLSLAGSPADWNPFDVLIERDSRDRTRADIVLAARGRAVPVVGVCLVEPYDHADVATANAVVERLLGSRELAIVPIDTRLDTNRTGLRTPAEVESLIARMDVIVTTRLHGMVLALKHGVPAIALDPEPGGGKIIRQARALQWPTVFAVDVVTDRDLSDALEFCLTPAAREAARGSGDRGVEAMMEIREEFRAALRAAAQPIVIPRRRPLERARRLGKRVARRLLPAPVGRRLSQLKATLEEADWGAARPFGRRRQVTPVSAHWGFDRGTPVDRYYIERFLQQHAAEVRGHVLEIGNNAYTRRFGGRLVIASDVLNVEPGIEGTTIVADLSRGDGLPSAAFDCVIVTQTLQLIYDVSEAIATIHRILRPGGIALITVPGITRTSTTEHRGSWYWSFTTQSMMRLFERNFGSGNVTVRSHGNVLAASAFLYGLASSELDKQELDWLDPQFELVVTVRALKTAGETESR